MCVCLAATLRVPQPNLNFLLTSFRLNIVGYKVIFNVSKIKNIGLEQIKQLPHLLRNFSTGVIITICSRFSALSIEAGGVLALTCSLAVTGTAAYKGDKLFSELGAR